MRVLALAIALALAVPAAAQREFVAQESDFQCLTDWKKVHKVRVFNRSKARLRKAIRILKRGRANKSYPVGTIIQLVPFEASVKRGGTFNPEGNGWEFFVLTPKQDGTTQIRARGGPEVVNVVIPCQQCHGAARAYDFVCETDHGCIPLNLDPATIDLIQQNDLRCRAQP